jgi:hypothetical protein
MSDALIETERVPDLRRVLVTTLATMAAAAPLAAPASAAATAPARPGGTPAAGHRGRGPERRHAVTVGLSDQVAANLGDPAVTALRQVRPMSQSRFITPWNVLDDAAGDSPDHFRYVDLTDWIGAAATGGYQPLVTLGPTKHGDGAWDPGPSVAAYAAHFRAMVQAFPDVHQWGTWNEPDYGSGHVGPVRAARYYAAAVRVERSLGRADTLVAGDFSRARTTAGGYVTRYLKTLRRLHVRPAVVSYHAYGDLARNRNDGVEQMLGATARDHSRLWLTEQGVRLDGPRGLSGDVPRQVAAAHDFLRLGGRGWLRTGTRARDLPPGRGYGRLDRIYYYSVRSEGRPGSFDSSLLDAQGRPRPAYEVLAGRPVTAAIVSPDANTPGLGG